MKITETRNARVARWALLSSPPEHGLRAGRPPDEINSIGRARSRDVIFGMPESIERRRESAACRPHSQDYVATKLFVLELIASGLGQSVTLRVNRVRRRSAS